MITAGFGFIDAAALHLSTPLGLLAIGLSLFGLDWCTKEDRST